MFKSKKLYPYLATRVWRPQKRGALTVQLVYLHAYIYLFVNDTCPEKNQTKMHPISVSLSLISFVMKKFSSEARRKALNISSIQFQPYLVLTKVYFCKHQL